MKEIENEEKTSSNESNFNSRHIDMAYGFNIYDVGSFDDAYTGFCCMFSSMPREDVDNVAISIKSKTCLDEVQQIDDKFRVNAICIDPSNFESGCLQGMVSEVHSRFPSAWILVGNHKTGYTCEIEGFSGIHQTMQEAV